MCPADPVHHVGIIEVSVERHQVFDRIAPIVAVISAVVIVDMRAKKPIAVQFQEMHGFGVAMFMPAIVAEPDLGDVFIPLHDGGKVADLAEIFKRDLYIFRNGVVHQSVEPLKADVTKLRREPEFDNHFSPCKRRG